MKFAVNSTSNGFFNISYEVKEGTYIEIELYTLTGQKVEDVYQGEAKANQKYYLVHTAANLDNGMYFFRMTNGKEQISKTSVMLR